MQIFEDYQKEWDSTIKISNVCKDIIEIVNKNNFIEGCPRMEFSIYDKYYYITVIEDNRYEQTYTIAKSDKYASRKMISMRTHLFRYYIRKISKYAKSVTVQFDDNINYNMSFEELDYEMYKILKGCEA